MIDVPSMLTAPVAAPSLMGIRTNGDMLDALLDYRQALTICNGQLSAIGQAYGHRDN